MKPPADAIWSGPGLAFRPALPGHLEFGLLPVADHRPPALATETLRTMCAAVLAAIGDPAGPADPDRVRQAVDEQIAMLRHRAEAPGLTPEAQTELAWAHRASAATAAAAGGAPAAEPVVVAA